MKICEPEVFLKVDASKIISRSIRFDLGIKYNYAKSLINLGYVPTVYVQDYLQHINSFNSFNEEIPNKKSPDDFIESFDSLIESLKKNGYQESEDKIFTTIEGELLNGAHRVSTLAALGREVNVHEVAGDTELYDFEFFQKKGLPENVSDRGIIGSLEFETGVRLLIVYPVVPNQFESLIESQISKLGTLFFKKLVPANFNLINNIKLINYFIHGDQNHLAWVGSSSDKFSGIRKHAEGSMGTGRIRFYLIKNISDDNFLHLKDELRKIFGVGNYSLHGTDSFQETQDVIHAVCHPESVRCAKRNLNLASFKLADWLKEMTYSLNANNLHRANFCVGGSGPLGAFGVRQISDLDLLSSMRLETFQNNSFVSFHDVSSVPYESSVMEFLLDPDKHFYFLGFKFISLGELKKMKLNRKETKDIHDLRLLEEIIAPKNFWNGLFSWTANRLTTLVYWRVRHRFNKSITAIRILLLKHRQLAKILKKLRSLLTFRT